MLYYPTTEDARRKVRNEQADSYEAYGKPLPANNVQNYKHTETVQKQKSTRGS